MESQITLLDKCLLELQDPMTTPAKALQLLSSSYLSPKAYKRKSSLRTRIFLAYVRFIIARRPDACVDGIWKIILKKTVMFTRNVSVSTIVLRLSNVYAPEVTPWLVNVLSNQSKCPDPYIRLELYRLYRIFTLSIFDEDKQNESTIYDTFFQTIREIQPHRLYQSGNDDDDVLFGVTDLNYFRTIFKETIFDIDYIRTDFIHLIRVFICNVGANPDPKTQIIDLKFCCCLLMDTIDSIDWESFSYTFFCYACETIGELTGAIINNKMGNVQMTKDLMHLRGILTEGLGGVCNRTCDLPRLLLSRQIQGPMLVRKHTLLLKNLETLNKNSEDYDEYEVWNYMKQRLNDEPLSWQVEFHDISREIENSWLQDLYIYRHDEEKDESDESEFSHEESDD